MSSQGVQLKWLALATSAAQHSLDHLLTSGAAVLYSKYLQGKLPVHLHPQLDALLGQTLSPLVSIPASSQPRPKPELAPSDTFRRLKPKWQKRTLSPNQTESKFRPSTAALSRTVDLSRKPSTAPCHQRIRNRTSQKDCFISLALETDMEPETEKVWTARKHRYDESQQIQKERLIRQREADQERQRLQMQLQTLQSAQLPIPFCHETGRLHELPEKHPHHHPTEPIHLHFEVTQNGRRGRQPQHRKISNTRKIISFCRQKRKRDQSDEACDFGNNGQRQDSSIPFLDLSEGIRVSEENTHFLHRESQNHQKRHLGESSFRSYTRQRMAATIVDQTEQPRVNQSKQTQRTTSQSVGGSLLWTQRGRELGHRLSTNRQLAVQCLDVAID